MMNRDDERRAAALEAIRTATEKHCKTRKSARAYLISLGIYYPDGRLRPEYGGEESSPRTAHGHEQA